MVKIYTTVGSKGSYKLIRYFKENNIEYKEINTMKQKLTAEEVYRMLELSENGTEDIISKRSDAYKRYPNLESMHLSSVVGIIVNNPSILKYPIQVGKTYIKVGLDETLKKYG